MVTFISDTDRVSVPFGITDLEAFRRWADADDFPETGRICWLDKEVWADMSREQIFTHLLVKNEFAFVLTGLGKEGQLGIFIPDGLLLSNIDADFAVKPDGTFVLQATLASDRVRLLEGAKEGYVELQGTPDMVLEVVSDSSEHKDNVQLRQAYWEAGIPEYWLVDARLDPPRFDILRHTVRGYVATRKQAGWVKSAVFGKAFQLTRGADSQRHPTFTVAVR